MINVEQARAALAATKGDAIALSKSQMDELLTEVETGQHARHTLRNLRNLINLATHNSGALA